MEIFHSYVKLPEGSEPTENPSWNSQKKNPGSNLVENVDGIWSYKKPYKIPIINCETLVDLKNHADFLFGRLDHPKVYCIVSQCLCQAICLYPQKNKSITHLGVSENVVYPSSNCHLMRIFLL